MSQLPQLPDAGVGERETRDFVVYVIATDGTRTIPTLTGIQVYLFKKTKAASDWSLAVSKNTTDDVGELDIIDVTVDGTLHTDGGIRLTPPEDWWSAAGDFELMSEVKTTPPYFAPDTEVLSITVVTRP